MIKIPLDILTANDNDLWQSHFLWPVNSIDVIKLRKDIEAIFFKILNELEDITDRDILKIIFNLIVRENLSLINALLVLRGFEQTDYEVDVSHQADWYGIFKKILDGNYSTLQPLFMPSEYKSNFSRTVKKLIKRRYKNLTGISRSDDILLFAVGDIEYEISEGISTRKFRHLDQTDITIRKRYSHKNRSHSKLTAHITDGVVSFIKGLEININDDFKNYLFNYHRHFIDWTCDFLFSVSKTGKFKEKEVWTGSGHNFFNRLLAVEVNKSGGEISCHEHGEPKAFYNSSVHGYGELGLCNRFVTYTAACVELYYKSLNNVPRLKDQMPDIDVSPVGAGIYYSNLIRESRKNDIRKKNRKILYVSGGFNNDAIFMAYRPHDMVYYEWQTWLFAILDELNYNVSVKYHPEALLKNRLLRVSSDIKVLEGLFQDHIQQDYILLFDNPCSTAFQIALASSLPIVFIDNKVSEMFPSVLEDLHSRSEIVEGFYDERNRFRVDPDDLSAAIEKSDKSKNYDFVNKYILTDGIG